MSTSLQASINVTKASCASCCLVSAKFGFQRALSVMVCGAKGAGGITDRNWAASAAKNQTGQNVLEAWRGQAPYKQQSVTPTCVADILKAPTDAIEAVTL